MKFEYTISMEYVKRTLLNVNNYRRHYYTCIKLVRDGNEAKMKLLMKPGVSEKAEYINGENILMI